MPKYLIIVDYQSKAEIFQKLFKKFNENNNNDTIYDFIATIGDIVAPTVISYDVSNESSKESLLNSELTEHQKILLINKKINRLVQINRLIQIKKMAKHYDIIYIATDNDFPGELTAYALDYYLRLHHIKRINCTIINKENMLHAINNPVCVKYEVVSQENRKKIRKMVDREFNHFIISCL